MYALFVKMMLFLGTYVIRNPTNINNINNPGSGFGATVISRVT